MNISDFFQFLADQAVALINTLDEIKLVGDISLIDFMLISLLLDAVIMFLYIKGSGDDDGKGDD